MSNMLSHLKSLFSRADEEPNAFVISSFIDARDLRSDLFLDFMNTNDKVIYQTKARCVDLSNEIVRFYVNSKDGYLPSKNMKVSGFFVIPKNRKKRPFNFTTTVVESLKQDTSVYIDVALPQNMTHGQRRNNLRISLTKKEIPNFRLWASKEISCVDSENNKKNKITWEPIEQEEFELIDISTSGILLSISKNSSLSPKLRKNFSLLCTGSFDIPQKTTTDIALVAKVCRITQHEKSNWHFVGLQFYRWAKVTEEGVTWINLDDDGSGIPFLGAWLVPLMVKFRKPQL